MALRFHSVLFCCTIWLFACAQTPAPDRIIPITDTLVYTLGSTPLTLTLRTYKAPSDLFFIHLHDNESTAEKAAIALLEKYGGQLLSFENRKQRNVRFCLSNQVYTFDPNRIFSDTGIIASLRTLSKSDTAAQKVVSAFAQFLLTQIPDSALVVALHNNTDKRFSIHSYLIAPLKDEMAAIHIDSTTDADNFILTTDSLLFQHYSSKNINAILQRSWPLPDDGSLSIFFSKKNRSYINIEAEHKHATAQGLLIQELYNFIEERKKLSLEIK